MLTARPQLNVWLIVSCLRKRSALHLTSKVGVHALRLTLWGRDLCGGRSSRGIPDTAHVGAVSLHTRVDSEGTPYFIMYEINTADEEVVARHLRRCSSTLAHFVSRRSDANSKPKCIPAQTPHSTNENTSALDSSSSLLRGRCAPCRGSSLATLCDLRDETRSPLPIRCANRMEQCT
jgi:hypothetical protein